MANPLQPQKILLMQTAFIGDVILATALLEELHALFPRAHIDVLVRKGNDGLFEGHPFVGRVWVWDKQGGKYGNLLRLLGPVRRQRYDLLLNLQRFATSGLFSLLAGAGRTVGFAKNPFSRGFSYAAPHQLEPGVHEVKRNRQLLAGVGGPPATEARMPRLYPGVAARQKVSQWQGQPYICIAPASVWFTKQFPPGKWIEFLKTLDFEGPVYLLGAPSDGPLCRQIADALPAGRVVDLSGQLSLLESAALMQKAVLNYVNDSAPMHLCSAVDAPVAAVFCSTVTKFGFGPLSNFSRVVEIEEPLVCRPCGLHGHKACPKGHFRCAEDIRAEQLTDVLRQKRAWSGR